MIAILPYILLETNVKFMMSLARIVLQNKFVFYAGVYALVFCFSLVYVLKIFKNFIHSFFKPPKAKIAVPNEEPKFLNDPKYGVHGTLSLTDFHNFHIHYVANGSKDKPLMLFLHGFPEFWYIWKYQLPEFGKDYYAVAIDLLGYGKSSKPKELRYYDSAELARCVKEVIKRLGYESCILVGHDWGGAVAFYVANNYPEVVERLITMNCPHPEGMIRVVTSSLAQLLKSSYMFFFQLPWLPEYVFTAGSFAFFDGLRKGPFACKNLKYITEEDVAAYKYAFKMSGFTGPLNFYRNLFNAESLKKKWVSLKMPICYIWGNDDPALGVELAEVGRKIHENCVIFYVDGASHWVNIDEPYQCNAFLRKFLED